VHEETSLTLHFYDSPPERWKSIRTTNILEWLSGGAPAHPVMNDCFANEASSDRILYGITQCSTKTGEVKP